MIEKDELDNLIKDIHKLNKTEKILLRHFIIMVICSLEKMQKKLKEILVEINMEEK